MLNYEQVFFLLAAGASVGFWAGVYVTKKYL